MRMRVLALACCLLIPAAPALAQDITVQDDHFILQFDETEGEKLSDFIDLAQKILQRPIRHSPAETGEANMKIYILGPQTVRQDQFFQYFQSILKAFDFIVVEYGPEGSNFLSVIKVGAAGPGRAPGAGSSSALIKSQAPVVDYRDLDRYRHDPATLITTSLPLKYFNSRDALQTFQTYFESSIEQLRAVDSTNALVVTGFGSHVWGVWKLVQLLDVPPYRPTPVIHKRQLDNASVDEIAEVLTELLAASRGQRAGQGAAQQQGAGATTIFEIEPRIIPEPRSNSLLITGDAEMVARIEEWIDVLDVETEPRGNTHVYRLKNTDATEVGEVLTKVLEQERIGTQQAAAGGQALGGRSLDIAPSAVPDRSSNSVIITASNRKYSELVRIIREMDVRRPQVLIECAIVETSKTLSEALAVGLAAIGSDVAVTSNFGTATGILSATAADTNAAIASTGGNFAFVSGGNVPIPFIINALQKDTRNRVLSRPYLMTNDNQEATLSSQRQTSYPTTTTTQTSTATSFQQVEAGITLTISPTISAGNYLRLRVKIEVSNFGATPPPAADGSVPPPDKTTREVETPVTLPDGHTAILGGLVQDNASNTQSKVPWFGDLPLIGWLFRGASGGSDETYLYIFITPHIIDTDFALLDELSANRQRDVERLGGDIRTLTADPQRLGDSANLRALGDDLLRVFDMPSLATPPTGELGVRSAPPAVTPEEPAPDVEEVFGFGDG